MFPTREARLRAVFAIALLGTACGCDGSASDPLALAANATPVSKSAHPISAVAVAPAVGALPDAVPLPIAAPTAPGQGYATLDRAWWFDVAVAQTPPARAFKAEGVRVWRWDFADGGRMLLEPVVNGFRSYYFAPGANAPFFVRDPGYAYGFDGGALVAMFGQGGGPVEIVPETPSLRHAARYFARGQALIGAVPRRADAGEWSATRPHLAAAWRAWTSDLDRNGPWRAWHDAHLASERARWRYASR